MLFNAVGLGAPLLAAVFAIPMLLASLGAERFGLLTLLWAVVSYFGLFDLGLGRALTQQLSATLARGERTGPLVATALALMAALGLVAGLLVALGATPAVGLLPGVPDAAEARRALWAMALALPAVVLTAGLRGMLEARFAFGIVNAIRLPMGLFTFIAPLVTVAIVGPRLDWIAAVLAAGRVLACAVHALFAARLFEQPLVLSPSRAWLGPLLANGGWLSVSNVVSPLMGYLDRFLIGALAGAAAVAVYVTPQELVTKLWIVPGALTAVLFPTFAAQVARGERGERALFDKAVDALLLAMLPITCALALFAHEALALWIDPSFAATSAPLMQLFAIGMLVNCIAHVPLTLMQGAGAARTTGLVHAVELPLFVALLWVLTIRHGPTGAAVAWLLRIALDTSLMFELCRRLRGWPLGALFSPRRLGALGLAALGFGGLALANPWLRALWWLGCSSWAMVGLWRLMRPQATAPGG